MMPEPTRVDNLPKIATADLVEPGGTPTAPATENPLAPPIKHTANEGEPDEFDYFTQALQPGAYFPGLPEYIERERNNFIGDILPDSDNTLLLATHRKAVSEFTEDGKPKYLPVRHNELAYTQGRTDEKYDARLMINNLLGGPLRLTLIVKDTTPKDIQRVDLLIDYFAKSFGQPDLPTDIYYGNYHSEDQYHGTLHNYQQERSETGEVKRAPLKNLTQTPKVINPPGV